MSYMQDRWPEAAFVCDLSFGAELLAQRAEAEMGARCVDHSQKHGPMCLAAERLATVISEGNLRHPDDPDLNAHVLAAVARQVGEQWRLAKPRGSDVKIDGVVALAMAVSTALAPPKRRSGVVHIY
jgi:phage terminase large subunit-like protein